MADVLVPNIFITRNYDHINNFFLKKGSSIEDLPANDPNSLVISAKTNNYLESFDLSYNVGSTKQQILTLVLVDTDGQLENKFFLGPFALLKEIFQKDLEKEYQMLGKTRDLVSYFSDGDSGHKIYMSFGIGNNTQSWSDPLMYFMLKANIDLSPKGIKRYTFKFCPTDSPLFRPRIQFNLDNPNPEREFLFLDYLDIAKIVIPAMSSTVSGSLPNISPSHVIYNLLKKYISLVATTDPENIIIILPDLPQALTSVKTSEEATLSDLEYTFKTIKDFFTGEFSIGKSFGISVENLSQSVDGLLEAYKTQRKNGYTSLPAETYRAIVEYQQELLQEATGKQPFYYTITSKALDSSISPSIPDWYKPLNRINVGYQKLLKTTDELVLYEENNLKLLSFWQDIGLIEDKTSKCIIVGLEQLILQWLYRNQIPEESSNQGIGQGLAELIRGFKPNYQLIKSKEESILSQSSYVVKYFNTISKKKIGSSFGEKPILDELAFDNKLEISNLFSNKISILELFDIPVFTHNLKNSNVLDINIENSEVYINAIRKGIRENFDQFFLSQVTRNKDLLNLIGFDVEDLLSKVQDAISETGAPRRENVEQRNFFGLLTGYTSEIIQNNLKGSQEFRDDLRNVLLQQLFLADIAKTDLSKFDFDTIDLELAKFTDQVTPQYSERYIAEGELEQLNLEQTDEQIRRNIQRVTGLPYAYTPKQVADILKQAAPLLKTFKDLLIQNGTNFANSINVLVLADQLRYYLPPNFFEKSDLMQTNGVSFYRGLGLSQNTQMKIFQVALLLSKMFEINLPDTRWDANNNYNYTGMTFKPILFGLPAENIAAEIFKYQMMNAYVVTIKTLPFFHLCNYRTMALKPAFLFSKKLKTASHMPSNPKDELDVFSGHYNIEGFRHVITTKECYSEFIMKKRTLGSIYG